MNKDPINSFNKYNSNIKSIIDNLNDIRKTNKADDLIMWYLKSNDNRNDITNQIAGMRILLDGIKNNKNSEIYYKIQQVFENTYECASKVLVSDKTIKKMDHDQYCDYIDVLTDAEDLLNIIMDMPMVEKNVSRLSKMKEKRNFLHSRIAEYNKKNKYTNPKKDLKSKIKTGLIFTGGAVVGAGLSCVPGVGMVRMGIATTKVATSLVNSWADKHPEGKIAETLHKVTGAVNDKCPQVASFLTGVKNKMRGSGVNTFLNGVSVGYVAGNVFELVTGNTLLDFANNQINSVSQTPVDTIDTGTEVVVTESPIETTTEVTTAPIETTIPITESIETTNVTDIINELPDEIELPTDTIIDIPPIIDNIEPTISFGDTIDVSSISQGYSTSLDPLVGNEPVNLFTDLGHNVHIGNEKILSDGTKMWALFQEDGTGYAWFKADDVLDAVTKTSEEAMKLVLK